MAYAKIPNLYKSQDILLFKEAWALEKIHGCLREDSLVSMADGSLKPISAIREKEQIVSFDEKNNSFVHALVQDVIVQDVTDQLGWYELEFENGKKLVCTEDHPILTTKGWVQAKDLTPDYEIIHFSD
jgi:hypothetical protein